MQDNKCSKCGKPVYFAERKTSLGKNWHPNCLKCEECGKVLSPGQHAERKGIPYCHNPCYKALFGPQILGYGSNISSPANFRKSTEYVSGSRDISIEDVQDGMRCIFRTSDTSSGPIKFLHKPPNENSQKRHSIGSIIPTESSSSYETGGSGRSSMIGNSSSLESVSEQKDMGLKCVYQSEMNGPKIVSRLKTSHVLTAKADVKRSSPVRGAELFKKVQSYNDHHESKRGQSLSLTEEDGNVRVQGPLRIYWGLKKPIMLKQFDNVPAVPTQKKRYSVITDGKDLQPLPEIEHHELPEHTQSPLASHGLDDSFLKSPSSEVVMRKTNIRKSNTVAYRGDRDRPNKWKRASINGHIYNFDTSVFTPVLGSCTSVTVTNKMTVQEVIKTLLDKFKVENRPEEYNLYIISEEEDERQLQPTDIPLLERLMLGPTETVKIFIRDRPDMPSFVPQIHIPDGGSPTGETPSQLETPLPEEVEQLMNIPEPVLRGLLSKFKNDEEQDISRLKAKYQRIKKRIQEIICDKKANVSRC